MPDHLGRLAGVIRRKGVLGRLDGREEVALGVRENGVSAVTGDLDEQLLAFAGRGDFQLRIAVAAE
jgi:hypothetical protein